MQQKEGQHDDSPAGFDGRALPGEKSQRGEEERELDAKGDQVGDGIGDGDGQPGKIDLAEYGGVAGKGGRAFVQAVGEIPPGHQPAEVKQKRRNIVGRQLGDVAKNDGEYKGREDRLDEEPERAENGLLVGGNKVAFDEQIDQVAVAPDLGKVDVKP